VYYSLACSFADVIMGSREEFDLAGAVMQPGADDDTTAARYIGNGASIVVIKHGRAGSKAFTAGGEVCSVRPFPIEARKGFGGGDGYAAGFLYGLFEGWNLPDCLEFASAEASMMVRSNNCSDDLPGPQAVSAFIEQEKRMYGEDVARGSL